MPRPRGFKLTAQTIAKMRAKARVRGNNGVKPWLGRRMSDEHRRKLRESHLGQKAWNKGRKSPERSGPRHHNWQGGKTYKNVIIRNSLRYRQWRCDVFTRDDFTCQMCGVRGGKVHADHIIPFAEIIRRNSIETLQQAEQCEELWNINNGRTLCVSCHKKTDSYLVKRKYVSVTKK